MGKLKSESAILFFAVLVGCSAPTVTPTTASTADKPVASLSLSIPNLSLAAGSVQNEVATAVFTDNSTGTVSNAVWTSSNPAVATVSAGVVTAVAQGSAQISAAYQGFSASAPLTVQGTPAPAVDPTGDPWANQTGWALTWNDEFNSTSVDSTKWTFDQGGGGWGNGELETYTETNASIGTVNGESCLVITADHNNGTYHSARLKTEGLYATLYGRIEARMQLPTGQGMWPAFWMLGANINQVNWPACGETDIMEMVGGDPGAGANNTVYGTIHWKDGTTGAEDSYQPEVFQGSGLSGGFHTYGVQWTPMTMTFYVDGIAQGTTSVAAGQSTGSIFQQPFFLILNLAVGGQWPGSPDAKTTFPQTLAVDWVRVYTQ